MQLTLMMGVLRLYRLAARPATSKHTPPPKAMMGSFRLYMHGSVCDQEISLICGSSSSQWECRDCLSSCLTC